MTLAQRWLAILLWPDGGKFSKSPSSVKETTVFSVLPGPGVSRISAGMFRSCAMGFLAGVSIFFASVFAQASAECLVESREGDSSRLFKLHLSSDCTAVERESHAVEAAKLVEALRQGQAVDLSGVVIRGDIPLDILPADEGRPAIDGVTAEPTAEVRIIGGEVSIVNSVVRGAIRHGSKQGLLIFRGPVTFAETKFEEIVDLSRAVFMQPIMLSGAVFRRESYFVQARFLRQVHAEKTLFGPHTRFHLSRFHESATFQEAQFGGLAEFLEITFDRDADFSHASFKSGTGFSGSQFNGRADFSGTTFDGDAFFTFTNFVGDASFDRATFRAVADYDDAQFNGHDDFSKTRFEKGVQFTRVKGLSQRSDAPAKENPLTQYVVTLALLVISAGLIAYLVRTR